MILPHWATLDNVILHHVFFGLEGVCRVVGANFFSGLGAQARSRWHYRVRGKHLFKQLPNSFGATWDFWMRAPPIFNGIEDWTFNP